MQHNNPNHTEKPMLYYDLDTPVSAQAQIRIKRFGRMTWYFATEPRQQEKRAYLLENLQHKAREKATLVYADSGQSVTAKAKIREQSRGQTIRYFATEPGEAEKPAITQKSFNNRSKRKKQELEFATTGKASSPESICSQNGEKRLKCYAQAPAQTPAIDAPFNLELHERILADRRYSYYLESLLDNLPFPTEQPAQTETVSIPEPSSVSHLTQTSSAFFQQAATTNNASLPSNQPSFESQLFDFKI